jgi:hypothetical protein
MELGGVKCREGRFGGLGCRLAGNPQAGRLGSALDYLSLAFDYILDHLLLCISSICLVCLLFICFVLLYLSFCLIYLSLSLSSLFSLSFLNVLCPF